MNKQKNAGFTLLEAIIVVAIISIVAVFAIPAYQNTVERNRLKQAVESFKSDLQLARTKAIKRSQNILITRTAGNAGAWCYGLTAKAACDCTQTNASAADFCEIKRVSGNDFDSTNLISASGNSSFDFRRGTIGANGVSFSTDNYTARVVFSSVGRVRICTPAGTTGLPTYPGC
ncbi:GspH/FimT family pseudopilin [Methylomarinum vadi]|uniref:GspH/FimT family pseudopilin n=1 Tax=Methylomarinum vadi TaxID=438855 RepID=UPI00068DACB2|nr:GspH/FimT family pseudopilin [Methylomarinum vadi]